MIEFLAGQAALLAILAVFMGIPWYVSYWERWSGDGLSHADYRGYRHRLFYTWPSGRITVTPERVTIAALFKEATFEYRELTSGSLEPALYFRCLRIESHDGGVYELFTPRNSLYRDFILERMAP